MSFHWCLRSLYANRQPLLSRSSSPKTQTSFPDSIHLARQHAPLLSVPNCHSIPIVQRVRRNRQRLPSSLLIENASDRCPCLAGTLLPEAFPIKASDNPGVGEFLEPLRGCSS